MLDLTSHEHEEVSWPVYDAQRIYLCRVCAVCEEEKLAQYRPEILSGYNQEDVDEPIEDESWNNLAK